MEEARNLRSLSIDELTGVIHSYPWFGAARAELCERMSKVGGSDWGVEQYADAAMYVSSRTIISGIVRSSRREDYSDKDVQDLLKKYIAPAPAQPSPATSYSQAPAYSPAPAVAERVEGPLPSYRRTVKVPGGDFFSSSQYESVRTDEDNYFSRFKARKEEDKDDRKWEDPELGFCTETLAWIYAEQGYFTEAKKIYSRLILRYPEKSAYFASLIEKMDK